MQEIIQKLALDRIRRHVFLCADQTIANCCDKQVGLLAWEYLKSRLKELGLDQPSKLNSECVFRTKANCLRVCVDGPIMLIYPDGVWYRSATPDVIETIIEKHLLGNEILEEYAILIRPLKTIEQSD